MAWFSGRANTWKVIFSVFYVTSFSSLRIVVQSHSAVRLDYKCIDPENVTEGKSVVPVIMMHGVLDVKETWNGIYENVSALTSRKVCIYDSRNHGGSSWNDTYTVDANVEDLESFVDMLKIDRAFLVGHSIGGQTAMEFALTNPKRVEGIFVEDIGPDIPPICPIAVGYLIRVIERILSKIPDGADVSKAKETILKNTEKYAARVGFYSFKKYMPIHFQNGEWKWKTNLKVLDKSLDNLNATYTKMEGKYAGKALFIYGETSPFEVANQLEKIKTLFPNVQFVPVETSRHVLHWFYPDYLKVLVDFLN